MPSLKNQEQEKCEHIANRSIPWPIRIVQHRIRTITPFHIDFDKNETGEEEEPDSKEMAEERAQLISSIQQHAEEEKRLLRELDAQLRKDGQANS